MRSVARRWWISAFSVADHLVFCHRLIHRLQGRRMIVALSHPLLFIQQLLTGCYIHPTAQLGNAIFFPHPTGIVIGKNVQIADHVTIFQHVTLGSHGRAEESLGYPIIGQHVLIYANSLVIGPVLVGDYAVIGAMSLVMHDVPVRGLVVGAPARLIGFVCDKRHRLTYLSSNDVETQWVCAICHNTYRIPLNDYTLLQSFEK